MESLHEYVVTQALFWKNRKYNVRITDQWTLAPMLKGRLFIFLYLPDGRVFEKYIPHFQDFWKLYPGPQASAT